MSVTLHLDPIPSKETFPSSVLKTNNTIEAPSRRVLNLTPTDKKLKQEQGLCFFRDKPYYRGHVC